MSQRLFTAGKVGLFLDSYSGGVEKRKSGETKIVVLKLRVQPFDAKLAASIDDGVGDESNVRPTLFKLANPEPKAHVDRVNFRLGCARQNMEIFASPDTEASRVSLGAVRISATYARTEKNVNGYAFCFTAAYGPAGKTELEFIHEWLHGQKFVSFEEAEPSLDFEEDGSDDDEELTDADEKARLTAPPTPMWDDDPPAMAAKDAAADVAPAKPKKEPVNRRLHSHQGKKKTSTRKASTKRAARA